MVIFLDGIKNNEEMENINEKYISKIKAGFPILVEISLEEKY